MSVDLDYVMYGLMGLAALLLIVNVWLLVRLARIRDYEHLNRDVERALAGLEELQKRVGALETEEQKDFYYTKLVRYDAFPDAKGKQSGSMILLNREGTGIVISILNSRDRSATYIKEIVEFEPLQALSPEEKVLLDEARKA
ncbi:DUF4446 family protein [Coprothermobacteraceae bacterium]|nr:DUF4446 family protein [Coprothermobacteraceae bacterium]